MSRTAIVVWLLAVSHMDSRAAASVTEMTVSVTQSVILPCPCSEDITSLVWQIGEDTLVNNCCEINDPVHESYVNRTQVFMSFAKGNCSLLFHGVSLNDSQTFTCYTFVGKQRKDRHQVHLTVKDAVKNDTPSPHTHLSTRVSVGVPLLLILALLAGLVVALLIRKQRQRRPRVVLQIQDPQAKLPMMDSSHV